MSLIFITPAVVGESMLGQPKIADRQTDLNLDVIYEILSYTIFHPVYCWFLAFYFFGKNPNTSSPWFQAAVGFAIVVDLIHCLKWINYQICFGPKVPCRPNNEPLVIVTGASQGLGYRIAACLLLDGFKVVDIDIKPPEIPLPNLEYVECDVSNYEQVMDVSKLILDKYGPVNVLVNNAGVMCEGKSLLKMQPASIQRTLSVNLLANFWTIKAFSEDRGHRPSYIVTISSVLGRIGPRNLSAYSASKAGAIALHDSISHELPCRTLLVTCGQVDTSLFDGVETPSKFFAPVLQSGEAAKKIVDAIERGECGTLSMPLYADLMPLTQVLPQSFTEIARRLFQMDKAMDTINSH